MVSTLRSVSLIILLRTGVVLQVIYLEADSSGALQNIEFSLLEKFESN